MKHLCVAFAAMILLACGALQAFDPAPLDVLVTPVAAPTANLAAPGGQGLMQPLAGSVASEHFPVRSDEFKPDVSLWPPEQYQADNAAVTLFLAPEGVAKLCGVPENPDKAILGCTGMADGQLLVVLPNPCLFPPDDFFAGLACHELGHVNGWHHADTAPTRGARPPPEPVDPKTIAMLGAIR